MNVMACSSVDLVLGNHPKSCMFCTTFRYVFLDLKDYPIEVPSMITLISPNRGCNDSSIFSFNFSSKEISQFSLPDEIFNMLLQIEKTRPCHAHGLYGNGNTCSYCACWDLPSFSLAISRKDRP